MFDYMNYEAYALIEKAREAIKESASHDRQFGPPPLLERPLNNFLWLVLEALEEGIQRKSWDHVARAAVMIGDKWESERRNGNGNH